MPQRTHGIHGTQDAPPLTAADFSDAFPNSRKIYLDGPGGIRVPMREIALSDNEPPLRVYDTSGPQEHDVVAGLPRLRADWVRPATTGRVTQMHYARRGEITPEMEFVALRESMMYWPVALESHCPRREGAKKTNPLLAYAGPTASTSLVYDFPLPWLNRIVGNGPSPRGR